MWLNVEFESWTKRGWDNAERRATQDLLKGRRMTYVRDDNKNK